MSMDLSQVGALADELAMVGPVTRAKVRAVVERGARNIKADWRDGWQGLAHAPALPAAITYDIESGPWIIEAEIGPDKDLPQGALGNLLEFGSSKNAPHPAGQDALDREEPRFIAALEAIGAEIL